MSQINTDKIASNSGSTTALTIADNGGVTAAGTLGVTGLTSLTTMNTTGQVGIGTSSPATQLHVEEATTGLAMRIAKGGNKIDIGGSGSGTQYIKGFEANVAFGNSYSGNTLFLTSDTERMKIDSGGRVFFNGSTALSTSQTSWRWDISGVQYGNLASAGTMQSYRVGGTAVGSIYTGASSTTYNTSSDHRLKENVTYNWDATTRLKQLKPARFNWIIDDTNTLLDGFIAHEVSSIVPEAITGAKDAVDADGNPDYQGIDQSKLVPLLVKTIQELEARLTAGGL